MNKFTIFNLQFSKNFQLFNLQPILKIRELSFDWDLKIQKLKISQKGFIKFTKRTLVSYLIISTVFFGTGLIYLFNPFGTQSADAAWFNDNWAYRKAVPISSHTAAETTKYISVTIANTNTLVTNGQLQSDCGDMRFTKQNGDLMPYYIASGCNGASTVIHVYFDSFPAGAQTVYFYYGNPSVSNGFSAADFSTEASSYVVGTVGSAESAPSPTLYWKFDDAQGTTAKDSTPNTLNGTLNNTPTWQTENQCIAGKCLYFSLNGNKSVSIADDPKLDFVASDNFTVGLWIKHPGAIAGTQNILAKAAGSPYAGYKIYMDASGDLCFDTRDGTNGADSACTSAVDFDDDAWHFVEGVKAGTSSITLYVDGKQRAQDSSIVSTGSLANSGTLYAGIDQDGTSNDWFGFIDEVKIFRDQSARTLSQVQADYNARSNPEGVSTQLGNNIQNMPAALSNGLVGYWKMDENTGTTISDSSGNGNTSSAFTGNTAFTTGKYASGLTFDGTNDVVRIPETTSTDLGTATDSFTISSWFKTTASQVSGGGYVVAKFSAASNLAFLLNVVSTNQLQFEVNGGTDYIAATTITVNDGVWHHFVGVRDVKNLKMHLYLDGVLKDSIAITAQNASNNDDISIGNGSSSYISQDFNGQIDETRIYNRALSSTDITQLYTWAPGPVGYWKLDERTGGSAYDASGYANNGTLGSTTATPSWANGKYGSALSYDGGDTVSVSDSSSLSLTGNFSLAAWVNVPNVSGYKSAVTKENAGQTGYFLYILDDEVYTGYGNGAWRSQTTSTSPITANTWIHIASTFDGTTLTTYVNGVSIQSSAPGGSVSDNSSDLGIGNASDLSSMYTGLIDEAKVYNYPRTAEQIKADMNAGHPAPGSPVGTPLGYWRFDEGYSTTANNVGSAGNSGTTYTGTITNMSSPATTISGWTNNGKFGKGLLFDGTNDRVDYGDMTVLEGISQATWSMWVNPTSLSTSQGILVKANNASTGQSWAIMTDASDSTAVRVRIATGATDVSTYGVTPTGALANGRWTHIEAVFDGTGASNTDRLKIYINGTPQTLSFTGTIPTTLLATGAIMRFSGWSDAGGSYFNGAMDELKIYTEPLTASQVKMDFNRSQSEVLGALSDSSTAGNDNTSTRTAQSNASQYCIPGDTSTCSGPSGEWMLNEGSGTSANDSSGNAGTGTITAGTGKYVNGKINKAYQFDGTDTLINAGSGSPLDNLPASGMTAEAWIYPTGAGEGNAGFIMAKNNGNSQNAGWLFLTLNTGGPTKALQFVIDGSTDLVKTTSDNVYSYNTWNHVAVTSNSNFSAGSAHIYVNGKEVSYSGSSGGSSRVSDAASSFYIGNASSSDRTFAGIIDQVRVFNYERTPAQIAWDYNQGKPIAHWKMDECQGTTINDISGNTETGTLTIGGSGGNTTAGTCTTSGAWFDGVTGKLNYSMDLDGTDDYITMGTASYNLQTGDAPFTIALWAKPSATRFDGCYFSYGGAASGQVISLCAESSNKMYSVHYSNDHAFTTTWTLGSWQHVILSYDPTSSTESLYVNGQLKETWTPSNLNLQSSATSYIGRASWSGTYVGATQIDDVKLYNYSLTASQAKTLFNDGATRYGPSTGAP